MKKVLVFLLSVFMTVQALSLHAYAEENSNVPNGIQTQNGYIQLSAEMKASNESTIAGYLMNSMGLNSASAAGVLANIQRESNFNPNALGDNGESYGICQWHLGRWDRMKNYCNNNGYDWESLIGQLHYLEYELKNYETQSYDAITHVSNNNIGALLAAEFWCRIFERPDNVDNEVSIRQGYVRNTYWPRYGNGRNITLSSDNPWYYYENKPIRTIRRYSPMMAGADIKWVQQALNVILPASLLVDGKYGSNDEPKVITFQQQNGLTANGIVDAATVEAMINKLHGMGVYEEAPAYEIDSRYQAPFDYRYKGSRLSTYESINGNVKGYIDPEDDCTVNTVYNNGWINVTFPTSSGTATRYAKASEFFGGSVSPVGATAPQKAYTYYDTDRTSQRGWIDPGDSIVKLRESGSSTLVVYPGTGGRKCAWAATSELNGASTPSLVEDTRYRAPFGFRYQGSRLTTYESAGGSAKGYIDPGDDCTVNNVYTNGWINVTFPTSSGTATRYAKRDEFLGGTTNPVNATAPKQADTFYESSRQNKRGWVDPGDAITKLRQENGSTLIIYPGTGGLKCAWIATVDLNQEIVPTGISLSQTSASIAAGQKLTLTATVSPSNAENKTVTWASSNTGVATVNNGVVTGVNAGSATITASTYNGKTATCTVNVVVNATGISLSRESVEMEIGGSLTLTATVLPSNASNKNVTWSSSNTNIVTVSNGTLSAKAEGSATITAKTHNNITATCNVTVKKAYVYVSQINLSRNELTLTVGDTEQLYAEILPVDATNQAKTWTSSNTNVATVSDGLIRAVSPGVTTITVTADKESATCLVNVVEKIVAAQGISLNKNNVELEVGGFVELSATVFPENTTDKTVTWQSSNADVATVMDGLVVGCQPGNAVIIATTHNGYQATCAVTVKNVVIPVTGITLDRTNAELEIDDFVILTATISPSDATDKTVTWSSSDSTVASVTSGVVTAKAIGNAVITAKAGNYTATCQATVKEKTVHVTSVMVDKEILNISLNGYANLTANVLPSNAANKNVTWSSSDRTIARVLSDGTVLGMKNGTAVITVTTEDGGYTDTCTVTVGDTAPVTENASVKYSALVQDEGWQSYVKDGETAGTFGQSKKLEAIRIEVEGTNYTGNIEYQTHVQKYGWENTWKKNGEISGSLESLRLESMRIRLTGELAEHYDVYYRLHVQKFGWLDWAKNGENSGSSGFSYRVEGIQIKLVEKGKPAPGATTTIFHDATAEKYTQINYQTQVQRLGWLETVSNGEMSGTQQQGLRVEGIKMWLSPKGYTGSVEYKSLVENKGWESNWKKDGELSGTSGEALRLEAIQIRLTDELATKYDIYYRVQAQKYGWLGWASNGAKAGSEGHGKRLEAIEIRLVEKGGPAPGSTENPFIQ